MARNSADARTGAARKNRSKLVDILENYQLFS
jgi:hypothetical protein